MHKIFSGGNWKVIYRTDWVRVLNSGQAARNNRTRRRCGTKEFSVKRVNNFAWKKQSKQKKPHTHTYTRTDRLMDEQTDRRAAGQKGRQIDRQADEQTSLSIERSSRERDRDGDRHGCHIVAAWKCALSQAQQAAGLDLLQLSNMSTSLGHPTDPISWLCCVAQKNSTPHTPCGRLCGLDSTQSPRTLPTHSTLCSPLRWWGGERW